jgi:two-component system, OmpR family, response regulator
LPHPLKRILLVEDDPDIQEMASLALVALGGYAVQVCGTARDALDHAPVFRPDLILLDVMMPGTDGPGALKALREIEATARTPVVFMTARVGRRDIAQYDELGCLGVIAKPFDPVVLPKTLEGIWGRRQQEEPRTLPRKEFEVLSRAYRGELPEKVRAMEQAAAALARGGWDRPTAESLYHHVHRMAGSAGLYGLDSLSRAAGILEGLLKDLLEGPWPPARSPAEIHTVVKAVKQAARRHAPRARPRGASC